MRNYNTQAEVDNIPNVNYKRNVICQKYLNYGASTDIQGYLDEQITENPKLLAWLFDDSSLVGKNYLTLLKILMRFKIMDLKKLDWKCLAIL